MIPHFEIIAIRCVLGCVLVILFRLILELHSDKAEYRRQQNKRPTKPDELACLLLHLGGRLRLFFRNQRKKMRQPSGLSGTKIAGRTLGNGVHVGKDGLNLGIHNSSTPNARPNRTVSRVAGHRYGSGRCSMSFVFVKYIVPTRPFVWSRYT